MPSKSKILIVIGLFLSIAQAGAADIVHDAEYYISEKQNSKKWAAEDKKLDKRLVL